MVWLNRIFGDTSALFSASSLGRTLARLIVTFVVFFAALSSTPGDDRANQPNAAMTTTSAAKTFLRWMQPSTAAAAPRKRQRVRNARGQAQQATTEGEASSEQPARVLAPLTPFIQIWPQAHSVKSDAPEALTPLPSQDFMGVAEKDDRLASPSQSDVEVVQADELSELDRAAAPAQQSQPAQARAQAVAFADTDGRAMPDHAETGAPVSRIAALAESVEAIPQAPWFNSVLFVIGGAIAAFVAARVFMRA